MNCDINIVFMVLLAIVFMFAVAIVATSGARGS